MHVIKVPRQTEFKDLRSTVGTSVVLIISSCMLLKFQERLNSKTWDQQWEPLLHQLYLHACYCKKDWIQRLEIDIKVPRKTEFKDLRSTVGTSFVSVNLHACHQSSKKDWIQRLEINSGNLCCFNYFFMHVIKVPRKAEFKDSRLTMGTSFVLIISSCMLSKFQERLNSKTRDWQWEPLLF